jgi:peptidoglycan/xylan/chitin deacetylase (PgdA/CDA1 family)
MGEHCVTDAFEPALRFLGLPPETRAPFSLEPEVIAGPTCLRRLHLDESIAQRLPGRRSELQGPLPPLREVGGGGVVLASAYVDGRLVPVVRCAAGEARLGFDPAAAIRGCLFEVDRSPPAPVMRNLPFHYHRVPGAVRVILARLLTRLGRSVEFPQWPEEPFVEGLRALVQECVSRTCPGAAARPYWPQGKRYAVALTHDVDDANGFRHLEAPRAVERKLGAPSTFFFVTHTDPLDEAALRALRDEGCEISAHGYNHDCMLAWLPGDAMEDRLKRSAERLAEWGGGGSRSPWKGRTDPFSQRVAKHFSYDSSCPDSDGSSGVATVFPFRRGALLELPITTPIDADAILLGHEASAPLRIWQEKLAYIRGLGGFACITTHPAKYFGGNAVMLATYETLLRSVVNDGDAWLATMSDIAVHWQGRERDIERLWCS